MLNDERVRLSNQRYENWMHPRTRPGQFRRMKHKNLSRRTHAHYRGQTCPWCKPGWKPARLRRQEQQA